MNTYRERLDATGLCDCGHPPTYGWPLPAGYTGGTGYGINELDQTRCYACCAEQDRHDMQQGQPIVLYLTRKPTGWEVSNWPGSLVIHPFRAKTGRHNWGCERIDVWFSAEGREWHGVNIGDNQIVRCKPLKQRISP